MPRIIPVLAGAREALQATRQDSPPRRQLLHHNRRRQTLHRAANYAFWLFRLTGRVVLLQEKRKQ